MLLRKCEGKRKRKNLFQDPTTGPRTNEQQLRKFCRLKNTRKRNKEDLKQSFRDPETGNSLPEFTGIWMSSCSDEH
jgi:hypothetical protein